MDLGKRRVAGCAGIGRIEHRNDVNMVLTYEIVKQRGVKMSSQRTYRISNHLFLPGYFHLLQHS